MDYPDTDASPRPPDIITSCQTNTYLSESEYSLSESIMDDHVHTLDIALSYNDKQTVEELLRTVIEDIGEGKTFVISKDFLDLYLDSLVTFELDESFMALAIGLLECFIADISQRLPHYLIDDRLASFLCFALEDESRTVQRQAMKILLVSVTSEKFVREVLVIMKDKSVFFQIIKGILSVMQNMDTEDEDWHLSILSLLQHFVSLDFSLGGMLVQAGGHQIIAQKIESDIGIRENSLNRVLGALHLFQTLTVDVEYLGSMIRCDICKVMVLALRNFSQNKEILQLCLHMTRNLSGNSEVAEYICGSPLLGVLNDHICQVFSNFGVQFLHEFDLFFMEYTQILSGLGFFIKADLVPKLVSSIHNIMCQFRDHVVVQNSSQQALLVITRDRQSLLQDVQESSFHIPLATVVLGNILIHGKCAQTFSSCCELLSLLCTSHAVREALGLRNTHIAIYTFLRYHKNDIVVSALGYKFLHRYCFNNPENIFKVVSFGFLNEICCTLDEMNISNRNFELFRHCLTLFKVSYGTAKEAFTNKEKYCHLIQNILVDIYRTSESLSILCLECLALLWDLIENKNAEILIGLALDCMYKYEASRDIHMCSTTLLQLLSQFDLPKSVVVACQQDLQTFKSEVSVVENVLVLLYLMIKGAPLKGQWIITTGIVPDLFLFGTSHDVDIRLKELAYAVLYLLGNHQGSKEFMLQKVCEQGNLEAVSCLLALGASAAGDFSEESPLALACKSNNLSLVHLLLEHKLTDLKTPLKVALAQKHHKITGYLLEEIYNSKEKDVLNFSGLELYDLQPEWFEPVLECSDFNLEHGDIRRWKGDDMADDIKAIGAIIEADQSSKDKERTTGGQEKMDGKSADKKTSSTSRTSKSLQRSQSRVELHQTRIGKALKHTGRKSLPRGLSKGCSENTVFRVDEDPSECGVCTKSLHPKDPRLMLQFATGVDKPQTTRAVRKESEHTDSLGRKIPVGFARRFYRKSNQSLSSRYSPYPESESELDVAGSLSAVDSAMSTSDMAGTSPHNVHSHTNEAETLTTELRELDLSDNRIDQMTGLLDIKTAGLQKLSSLRKMVLAYNLIKDFPQGLVQYVPSLTCLVMHHNALDRFPVSVLQCPHLQCLDLSHNQLCDFTLPDNTHTAVSLTELNLSHNLLLSMPVSLIRRLPKLQTLQISSNHLEELPLEDLVLDFLQTLDLSYNNLSSVGDEFCLSLFSVKTLLLQGNTIVELPCYETGSTLDSLEHLDLSNNTTLCQGEEDVPAFILALPKLKILNLSITGLSNFVKPQRLSSPNLTQLYLAHNSLRKFHLGSHYSVYANLQKLDLSHNSLIQLPAELGLLSVLASLDVSHNKRLSSLPDEMGRLSGLWELKLEGLKLDLDNSLLQGRTKDLIGYLNERYKKSVEYNQLKLMLVGYGGRGKTSLVQALMKESKTKQLPTVGINVKDWRLWEFREGRIVSYTLSVWDFAGQEDFYSTHQCFMSDRALYLVVYNLSLPIQSELESIKPWLQNIHARAPHCPVIIVGTHYDKVTMQASGEFIQTIRGQISDMCEQPGYPEVVAMVEVSCVSHSSRLERLRVIIKDVLSGHEINGQPIMGHKVPASYVKLQDLLMRELSNIQQSFPIITHKRLKVIVEKGGLTLDAEELKQAVKFLHHSGVILHYEDSTLKLNDFYFLSPQWLCRMMAQVVTVREINPCVSPQGVLRKQDLSLLFSGKKLVGEHTEYAFPPNLIPQYLRLLYKFDIALPLNDTELLIPARLPSRPEFAIPWTESELVRRVYTLEYTPAGLWSRLITRLLVFRSAMFGEENVEKSTRYWTDGVFVQSSVDSVFYLVESKGPTSIQISVPPNPHGARLLGDVVYHLDLLIEEWYPGLLVITPKGKKLLRINVPCILCTESMPFSFPLDYIIKVSEQSETIRCPNHEDAMPIKVLAPDVLMSDLDLKFHLDQSQLSLDESPDQLLGHGTFGVVYRATYQHRPVAVKKYLTTGDKPAYKNLRQEALILSKLVHPSLIQLVAVDSRQKLLLLEFAPGGALRTHLSSGETLNLALRHRMALQICEGLRHLHEKQIIYRDLKPDNILVFSLHTDAVCNVKISDYGIAQMATQTGLLSQEGTPGYRAAEVIRGDPYSTKADMFSFGVTLYELVTCGVHPFDDNAEGFGYKLDNSISAGLRPQPLSSHGVTWSSMQDVIELCLAPVPDERPSASEVVDFLDSAEALCKVDNMSLSKNMAVDILACMKESGSTLEKHAVVSCGSRGYSQLTSVRLGPHMQVKGSLFTGGRVLRFLYISSNLLLVGTEKGTVYSLEPDSFLVREPACVLSDTVLCMTHIKGDDAENTVVVGTADGHVTLIPLNYFKDGSKVEVVDIDLGSAYEAVTCMCRISRHYMYIAVNTKLYRFQLKPRIVPQMDYSCNLWESDATGPISHMVRHKTYIHMIKKWGHRLYKVSVRSVPYIKNKLDTIKAMKRSGIDVANELSARLLCLILVEKSTLWVTSANGCLLTVDADTYSPLTCLQIQGSELRHMLWLPHSEVDSCVLMSAMQNSGTNSDTKYTDQFCEIMVWRADLPKQTQSFQEYRQKRASIL